MAAFAHARTPPLRGRASKPMRASREEAMPWEQGLQDATERKPHDELDPEEVANDVFDGDNFDQIMNGLLHETLRQPQVDERALLNPDWNSSQTAVDIPDWEVEEKLRINFVDPLEDPEFADPRQVCAPLPVPGPERIRENDNRHSPPANARSLL
jgi:hypothetical protein